MSYPPSPYRVTDTAVAVRLMAENPFAHFITESDGPRATRIPFVCDCEDGRPVRLRGHVHGRNPQVRNLDGARALVAFSGPASYVSPHWRAGKLRGGTYDYEEVQVRGTVHVVEDIEFFRTLIDDLSSLIEPQYPGVGDYPVFRTSMLPVGYVEAQLPHLVAFRIEIESMQATAKLHQDFSVEDRRSVVEHLARSHREGAREIARRIAEDLGE